MLRAKLIEKPMNFYNTWPKYTTLNTLNEKIISSIVKFAVQNE